MILGGSQAKAAKKAGEAQAEAAREATEEQRRQFNLTRLDFGPQRFYGATALRQMAGGELGLPDLGPHSYDAASGAVGLWNGQPGMPMASSPAPAQTLAQLGQGGAPIMQAGAGSPRANFMAMEQAGWRELGDGTWEAPDGRIWNADLAEYMAGQQGVRLIGAQAAAPLAQLGAPAVPPYGQAPAGGLRSLYRESPGFQFALNRSQRALENSAAGRGLLQSGATLKALQENAIGHQNLDYGNFYNRLAGIAGQGGQATSNLAQLGQQAAQNIGNTLQQEGAARASGYVGAGNARTGAMGNLFSLGSFALSPFGPFSTAGQYGRVGPLSGLFG